MTAEPAPGTTETPMPIGAARTTLPVIGDVAQELAPSGDDAGAAPSR